MSADQHVDLENTENTEIDSKKEAKDHKDKEKTLGKLIRKTLIELIDDFSNLGGEEKFCESLRESIRIKGPLEILKHLRSPEFEKNHFLLGKLPLSFLIDCDKGLEYIKIMNLATENSGIETWFNSITQTPTNSINSGSASSVASNQARSGGDMGIESVLNMLDPSLNLNDNSPLIALTKDLTKEFMSEMPTGGNMNLNQMMKKIQSKLETKMSSGELDVTQLQTQAEQVMSKISQNPELSGILSNTELLAGMAGMGNMGKKKR